MTKTREPGGEHSGSYSVDYLHPAGEPALVPPDSPQWRVFKNPVALVIGGVAAVLLEFAEPRIRSGVWDHSIFRENPAKRAHGTLKAALAGVYAAASVARRVISRVNHKHGKVVGQTPAGEYYRAFDPELLDWVAATAGYGFLEAYHRFVKPMAWAERQQYYRDGEPVARLYGVKTPLRNDSDFFAMLDRLFPRFEAHRIVFDFLDTIRSGRAVKGMPRVFGRILARGAVSLLPLKVRQRLELGPEFDLKRMDRLVLKTAGVVAEYVPVPGSPPWQAARRLGLPGNYAWRRPRREP